MKNRLTPEKRKLARSSDEEWQQYLKAAQNYQQSLQNLRVQPKNAQDRIRAHASQLKGGGPRQVTGQPGNGDPASIGQPLPPPDLREAQRLFTGQKK